MFLTWIIEMLFWKIIFFFLLNLGVTKPKYIFLFTGQLYSVAVHLLNVFFFCFLTCALHPYISTTDHDGITKTKKKSNTSHKYIFNIVY